MSSISILRRDEPSASDSPYNYIPTEWICILFIVLFSCTSLIHTVQAVRCRMWFLLSTVVVCGIGEVIGWSGRLWTSRNPPREEAFFMGIVTTTISPSFLTAAIFALLGRVIERVGTEYSWLTPRWLLATFLTLDLTALIVQSSGGAMAATANTREAAARGGNIMMIGIIIQLVAMVIFSLVAADFIWRVYVDRPARSKVPGSSQATLQGQPEGFLRIPQPIRLLLIGMSLSTFLVVIRSIYRTIELADGWNGRIISTEWYFNAFDATPIVLAIVAINLFHPGRLIVPSASAAFESHNLKEQKGSP